MSVKLWITSFDDDSVRRLHHAIVRADNASQDILPVYIMTEGGSVDHMLAMVDVIKASAIPVATIGLGQVLSAGVDLLAAGRKGLRFLAPSTTVMVHDGSVCLGGTVANVRATAEHVARQTDKVLALFASHTAKPVAWWRSEHAKRMGADWYMGAAEAVSLGIADHAEMPTLGYTDAVTVSLAVPDRAAAKPRRKSK